MQRLNTDIKLSKEEIKKLKKLKRYRHQEALDNQEVVTPPELVDFIFSHLKEEDFTGDILDPCVGPGALVIPLLGKNYKSLTVCDIQREHLVDFSQRFSWFSEKDIIDSKRFEELDEW